MTKLYSLAMNGKPAVTVSMEVPDFLPRTPKLNKTWLRGVITEQVAQSKTPRPARSIRPSKVKHALAA
jgi:hypothetical protein